MEVTKRSIAGALLLLFAASSQARYEDGRPSARLRMEARDQGVVLRHGDSYDALGARDVWVYESNGTYFMHYDAAGPTGWRCALATSADLIHWRKKQLVLDLGKAGDDDFGSASYCTTYRDSGEWNLFYLGTPNATPTPDRIPSFPYLTLKAHSSSPYGPWTKQPTVVPFRPKPATYYATTASPGPVILSSQEYLQFFSASVLKQRTRHIERTIGIARTKSLDSPWRVDPEPIVPSDEQIENASLYFEPTTSTWFLFANHIGISNGLEYTDAIWVYWTKDLERWNTVDKAVVLDARNCKWSSRVVGSPSVMRRGTRLAVFYDGLSDGSISHMRRDIGLAWLDLPLRIPMGLHQPPSKSAA